MQHDGLGGHNGSVSQSALNFTTHSMQNQIHELAKTLSPPRKQNTACDACRTRKVKCNRLPGQDKCQVCSKHRDYRSIDQQHMTALSIQELPMHVAHFVQQATSEKKRTSALNRRPRNLSTSQPGASSSAQPFITSPIQENGNGLTSPRANSFQGQLTWKPAFNPPMTINTPMRDVLAYMFGPPDQASDHTTFGQLRPRSSYNDWGDLAVRLEDEKFRAEFALDLVEVFFQIVHTRIPLLNPEQFRLRLNTQLGTQESLPASPSPSKPLHPALVATVLAWGAKFSEHPLLVADRRRPNGQSLLAKTTIDRARELAEAMKVHRIATHDHIVIGLLMEPLQSQNPEDTSGFHGFWLTAATRNLLDLGINHKSVMANIQEPEGRGTMVFAWWMACLCDAYHSVYYRRKPVLDDDDYDIDFYTADPVTPETVDKAQGPSPREQLEFLGYYRAAHALARIARRMSRHLWKPTTDADGIAFDILRDNVTALSEWRNQYLTVVGVPRNFEAEWDFVSAVSACASDATYHIMWIILFNALDEFGLREINEASRMGNSPSASPRYLQMHDMKRKVAEEALHGALRIAGLAGVLTSNGYLKLDPAVMLVSCIQAGMLLARLGRPEAMNCIAGLEQYSHSYEEAGDQAVELKRIYNTAKHGDLDLNHMHSVVPRPTSVEASQAMMVDEHSHRSNGSSVIQPSSLSSADSYAQPVYGN